MNAPLSLGNELAQLLGKISWTRAQIEVKSLEVAQLDLGDLPDRVARICDAITSLPVEQARPYAGALEKLIDNLNWLTEEVSRHRSEALGRLSAQAKPGQGPPGDDTG